MEQMSRTRLLLMGGVALAAAVATLAVFARRKKTERHRLQIDELWVYPVKAVSGQRVTSARLTATGLQWDRCFVVIRDRDRAVVDQAQCTALKTATASIDEASGMLVVSCPKVHGDHQLQVPLSDAAVLNAADEPIDKNGAVAVTRSVGAEAAAWFSKIVGEPVHLVRVMQARHPADVKKHLGTSVVPQDTVAMQSYGALHLVAAEGLKWLNDQMKDGTHVGPDRFRPNVVLSGAPFGDEDSWKTLRILQRGGNDAPQSATDGSPAAITLRIAKHTGRCFIPTLDENGQPHPNYEPTATLRCFRALVPPHQVASGYAERKAQYMFGVDAFHDSTGVVRVGDVVEVTARQPPPAFVPPAASTQ